MSNCPICGGIYAPSLGVVVNKEYPKITICPRCKLSWGNYSKLVKDRNLSEAENVYNSVLNGLDKYCKDEDNKKVLKEAFILMGGDINEARKKEEEKIERLIDISRKANNFLITSGYNFEGYRIVKYHKFISASTVRGTGWFSEMEANVSDVLGLNSSTLENKMDIAKEDAHNKLTMKAVAIGANALIGVDFDYFTLGNNMIAVSANGTAVTIEKIEE